LLVSPVEQLTNRKDGNEATCNVAIISKLRFVRNQKIERALPTIAAHMSEFFNLYNSYGGEDNKLYTMFLRARCEKRILYDYY
jgi:hypothetical protein